MSSLKPRIATCAIAFAACARLAAPSRDPAEASLHQREEAIAACFRGEARGCLESQRLGAPGSAVTSTVLVELDGGGRADALMFIPGTPLLLVSANGRLALVDSAAGVGLSPFRSLSSAPVHWRAPWGDTTLGRDVRYLQPAWNEGHLVGLIEETTGQMHLWRPALPLRSLATGKSNARPPAAPRPGHAQVAIALGESRVEFIDLDTGAELAETSDLGGMVSSLAFSADGKRLAVGLNSGDISLIDPDSGAVLRLPKRHARAVGSVAFAPSGRVLASTGWGQAFLWDLEAGAAAQPLPEDVDRLAFSPDGRWLAAAATGGLPLLLDAKSGRRAAPPLSPAAYGKRIDCVAFSPDGALAAFWTDAGLLLARLSGQPSATPVAQPAWFTELRPLAPPDPPRPPPIAEDGRLAGRISFESKPVADADVVLTPESQEWDDAKALGERRTRSGKDGSFSFAALPRIGWELRASVPARSGFGGIVKMREQAEWSSLEVKLEQRATLTGRLLDAEGRPVHPTSVSYKMESYSGDRMIVHSVRTGEHGAFVIDHLTLGRYRLQATGADGSFVTRYLKLTQLAETTTELRLRREGDPAVLRVHVVFDSGGPVAGAKVQISSSTAVGETDARGRFVTDDFDPQGQLIASAEWQGQRVGSTSLQSPFPDEVLLAIPDAEVLILGGTEPGAFAVIRQEKNSGESFAVGARTSETRGQRYASLGAGRYVAWLRAADGRFGSVRIELRKGEKREVDVPLHDPVALRGRVVDEATGRPVAHVRVSTQALLMTYGANRDASTEVAADTGPDGRFLLRGLSPGRHVLVLADDRADRRLLATAPDAGEIDLGDVAAGAPRRFEEKIRWLSTLAESRGARVVRSRYRSMEDGDLIVEVNGVSAAGMEGDEIEALLDLKDPAQLVIEPLNGPQQGQRKPLTLPRRRR